jgi:hypothetical protein
MDPAAPARLAEIARRYPTLERCHDGGATAANAATLDAQLVVAGRALSTPDAATIVAALRNS